ncbi:MAG TPA: methyltransferase [Thermodesulfobacteriota bacterium]
MRPIPLPGLGGPGAPPAGGEWPDGWRLTRFPGAGGAAAGLVVRERGRPGYFTDHASRFLAAHLAVPPGAVVAEPGCGTAALSVLAARLGAGRVFATDVDATALAFARATVEANGPLPVTVLEGDLLDPLPAAERLDLVVALLPHKPAPVAFSVRYYGGEDGTDLVRRVIEQASHRLGPRGVLLLYHHSIANLPRVRATAQAAGFSIETLASRKRYFTEREFDGYAPGGMAHLERLRREGAAEFHRDACGLYFVARVLRLERRP